MKLMWLCNMVPGAVQQALGGAEKSGLWVDHVLSGLRGEAVELRILCLSQTEAEGELEERCSFACFREGLPYRYQPELEQRFCRELERFRPDVIHIWGTEYGHSLAMVNAAGSLGLLDRVVISIQGLCSVISRHYSEGIPEGVCRGWTFRDLLRQDNIRCQQRKFALRGELERQALGKVSHILGRTPWDRACTYQINPKAIYHTCNETLREEFYTDRWQYEACRKHRIFASGCSYPVKGFHYLLEALAEVVRIYPDATLAVPGQSCLTADALRRNGYQKYLAELIRRYGLEDRVEFLGDLTAAEMKAQYLAANVFVLPSTIENSPNSLGEAMLLGVPCVASDVGGVSAMLRHGTEGYVYQSTAPYMLAHYIREVFSREDRAAALGQAAKAHASRTHDPETNLRTLLDIYRSIP